MTAPIVWPSTLPLYPSTSGLSGTISPARSVFQPEQGPPIQRPNQSARNDVYNVTFMPLTQAQIEAFRTFHDVALGLGSLKFAMPHPVKRIVRAAQIVGEPSEAIQIPGDSPAWSVSFQMMMVDVDPAYFADITLANGFVEYTGA